VNPNRKLAIAIILAGTAGGLSRAPAVGAAQAQPPLGSPPFACRPALQLRDPLRCPEHGPGGAAARRARTDADAHPLPTTSVDPDLGFLPFDYIRVSSGGADLYPSPQEAADEGSASDRLPGGFLFLSYSDVSEVGGAEVYATPRGYLNGDRASQITPLAFHGLAFQRTPAQSFGWIVAGTFSQSEPGGAEDWTDHWLPRLTMVRISDTRRVGEWNWYEIAPNADADRLRARAAGVRNPDLDRPLRLLDSTGSLPGVGQARARCDDGRD
jgi:hypothetical protein